MNNLSCTLLRTDERLAEVKTKLLLERKQSRASQYSTIDTRSVLESSCPRDLSNRLLIARSFSGENVMVPTSNLWHSIETKENCKTKVIFFTCFRFRSGVVLFHSDNTKSWLMHIEWTPQCMLIKKESRNLMIFRSSEAHSHAALIC